MSLTARQSHIRELIARRGEQSVAELAAALGVSGMTIRRDLRVLAEEGRVIRTHGGATLGERVSFEFAFLKRVNENQAAKQAIAKAAMPLVSGCHTIMLDGSTTTLAIARRMRGMSGLTVVTTSLPAAAELQYEQQIEVLLPGGYLRPASPDLAGPLTESNLESLRADVAFLGADAIDVHGNVYSQPPDNTPMLLRMAASAQRVYITADHSKLGRTALRRFGRLAQWDGLVTDDGADKEFLDALEQTGAHVIVGRVE